MERKPPPRKALSGRTPGPLRPEKIRSGSSSQKSAPAARERSGADTRKVVRMPLKPSPLAVFDCVDCGARIERRKIGMGLCKKCATKRAGAAGAVKLRRGRTVPCAQCGELFYAQQSKSRRYCSQACMGFAQRKPPYERTCTVCGTAFLVKPGSGLRARKTCSLPCRNEAKRRQKVGTLNPMATPQTAARTRWYAGRVSRCAQCNGARKLRIHHVVYEQHVRREHGDIFEPDNGLTLCWDCHNRHHHTADGRLKVSTLRPENIEFAFGLLGAAAFDYFNRYYENDCVDALAQRAGISHYVAFKGM